MRQQFEDCRRKLISEEQVQQMKAKYGGRANYRQWENPSDLTETPRSKIPRVCFVVFCCELGTVKLLDFSRR